jgi:localization factor PodJL
VPPDEHVTVRKVDEETPTSLEAWEHTHAAEILPEEPATQAGAMQPTDPVPASEISSTASTSQPQPAMDLVSTASASPSPAKPAIAVPVEAGPVALREAADAGDAKALFETASRYADGRGVTADMKEAAKWYEKSAELGFAPAQYRIGNLYEKGVGVERDVQKSKTWYQLAAAQGNASAMHNLAVLFAMGADGTADNESAARWFTDAAELGVKDSQFNLGILAAKGVGMTQNLEESYKWFALVAKAGDRDASAKRDEIANALRPEQLERARAAAELWKAKPLDPQTNAVDIPDSWQESGADTTASIDMKKAVQNIQAILNKNGYEAGNADGVMGEKTKSAIIAFQKDNELVPTGEIDEKLVRALIARK